MSLEITEEKHQLNEAECRAKELDTILSALSSAIILFDSSGFAVRVSSSAAFLFGFDPSGTHQSAMEERVTLCHPSGELIAAEDFLWNKALRGETVINQRVRLHNQKGRTFILLASAAPIVNGQEPNGAVCILHDISERENLLHQVQVYAEELAIANTQLQISAEELKAQKEEIRKAHDELEKKVKERTAELSRSNRALQEFAFVASHDLQEPLRKVMAFGERLMHRFGGNLGEDGRDYLRRMIEATLRMQALLKSLLEYSRVTSKAQPFVNVELGTLLATVMSDLEVRIEKTGAVIRVGALPSIEAEPNQMRQLFQNIISNALKFQKEDQKPVLSIHADMSDNGETVQITIEDNGIGFEPVYLDRIFEPFQRLHGRSSKFEGVGMGLAICQRIVEWHGGSITARSEPGTGSAFLINLPVRHRS